MASFDEIQFPTDISWGASGGPEFSTDIVVINSGFEERNQNWATARGRWNVAQGIRNQTDMDTLIAFFRARGGRARGFRFKDWTDFKIVDVELGVGDASKTVFQFIKKYTSGLITETRNLLKLVSGTVTVYLDDVAQGSGFTLDLNLGTVTFSVAPGVGVRVDADAEFDIPARFDTDHMPARLLSSNVLDWPSISLVEIRQ